MIGGLLVSTFLTLFLVPCLYAMTRRPKPVMTPAASVEEGGARP